MTWPLALAIEAYVAVGVAFMSYELGHERSWKLHDPQYEPWTGSELSGLIVLWPLYVAALVWRGSLGGEE